ncbi:MAG: hypothetical protein O7G84_00560 [Gammaproteobacteria bacterium]|nr:hypothetical protein [Gammaproteobacteria bacterium]
MLDDACMKKLRKLALEDQRTLSDLVNELLAEGVQRREQRTKAPPLEFPTFSMGRPKIDIADRDALEDAMGP